MNTPPADTRSLYDQNAGDWVRQAPLSLSDFTARPQVMALCEPLTGKRVLDLGCGEGYCSRMLKQRGAAEVLGYDISPGMIDKARRAEAEQPLGIRYEAADVARLSLPPGSFDLVVAVFLFNYLPVEPMQAVMAQAHAALAAGGRFVFAVPHPAFAFMRQAAPPFFFDVGSAGYFSDRNRTFPGKIWKRDGAALDVQLVHKTFEDYFDGLRQAGFVSMPSVTELRVTSDMLNFDKSFFGPLWDVPLHLAVKVARE